MVNAPDKAICPLITLELATSGYSRGLEVVVKPGMTLPLASNAGIKSALVSASCGDVKVHKLERMTVMYMEC